MNRAFIAVGLFVSMGFSRQALADSAAFDAPLSEEPKPTGPTRMDYAASLMAERDYYRAVSVYKEAAFFETDPSVRLEARYHIGRAYRISGRYELSLRGYASWLSEGGKDSNEAGPAYAAMAAALLGMRAGAQAPYYLDLAEAKGEGALAYLYRGVMAMQGADWTLAKTHLQRTIDADPKGSRAGLARAMISASEGAENAPTRSPFLAGLFSTVVPGGGQAYTGHYVDAAQAFAFVGLLGFSSFLAYRYEASRDSGYPTTIAALSLTTLFHAANVVGAVKTADFFNRRQRELSLEGAIPRALKLDY